MGKNFSRNNLGQRNKSDFYQTPYSLTRELLKREKLNGTIYKPSSGKGAILKVLDEFGYNYEYGDIQNNYAENFLNVTKQYDTVITNPPFSLFKEFILKAKQIANNKIIFLLPLSYLHGKERLNLIWRDKEFLLRTVYVFSRYPLLEETIRDDGKFETGMQVYAWFVWDKQHKGKPLIDWIDVNDFVVRSKLKIKNKYQRKLF